MSVRSPELDHLSDLRGGTVDVAGAADQRHDVADIEQGFRAQRHFATHPRQRAQEHAARIVPDAIGDLLQAAAVQLALGDQHFHDVAGDRAQDFVGIDLVADDGSSRRRLPRWSGNDDVVAGRKHGIHLWLDIGAIAHDALDHGPAADLILDLLDRAARCDGDA